MQFGHPFDDIYSEVIQKETKAAGFEVVRIDEVIGPGIIFEDIKKELERSN
jgi:hypothetical protein